MKSRLASALVTAFLIALFGFGVFLLVVAEDMPAPGLLLMTISGVLVLSRLLSRRNTANALRSPSKSAFSDSAQALRSYDEDFERRQRGDFDMDTHNTRR